jgi:catechol-2,3-dioxygenase
LTQILERSIRFFHEKVGLDITGTEKWRSMGVSFLSGGGYRHHVAASEKQKKQQQEEDNKNQFLINDLDGIQILIKSE